MRRHYLKSLSDFEAGSGRVHDERADAFRTRGFAGAREENIKIGNSAVRNPRLLPVNHIAAAFPLSSALERSNVRACVWLRNGEGGNDRARGHTGKIAAFLIVSAEEGDRARAQPLHCERKIGKAGVARQGLAKQTYGARIDRFARTAVSGAADGIAQPTSFAKPANQHPALFIDFGLRRMCRFSRVQVGLRPLLNVGSQGSMSRLEEGPVEMIADQHPQSPLNTCFCLATKAS